MAPYKKKGHAEKRYKVRQMNTLTSFQRNVIELCMQIPRGNFYNKFIFNHVFIK